MNEEDFASQVEDLLRKAAPAILAEDSNLSWESFHEPLLQLIQRLLIAGGQQNPDMPGKVRIDMGLAQPHGGLKGNADTILIIDFNWVGFDFNLRFFAEYDLAEELVRYAEVGEQGWDVARQIDQLERTISRLKAEAKKRDWYLPNLAEQQEE